MIDCSHSQRKWWWNQEFLLISSSLPSQSLGFLMAEVFQLAGTLVCGVEPLSAQNISAEVSFLFFFVFFRTAHLVLSWLWSGVSWQPCPSAPLFLFMFVIDTQPNKESVLHACLCFGRPGLALGMGDALDPLTVCIGAVLVLSKLCGKWWAAITPNLYHRFKRIITIVKKKLSVTPLQHLIT